MKLIDLINVTNERDIDIYSFDDYFLLRCSSTTFKTFHPYLSNMEVEAIYPTVGGTFGIRLTHTYEDIKYFVHVYFKEGEMDHGKET